MILDRRLQICSSQAVTASAASEDYIDLVGSGVSGSPALETVLGGPLSRPLYLLVNVEAAATSTATDTSVTITVETHEDSSFGAGTLTIGTSGVIAKADLAIDTNHRIAIDTSRLERYVRAYFTVGGSDSSLDTGTFSAYITEDLDTNEF